MVALMSSEVHVQWGIIPLILCCQCSLSVVHNNPLGPGNLLQSSAVWDGMSIFSVLLRNDWAKVVFPYLFLDGIFYFWVCFGQWWKSVAGARLCVCVLVRCFVLNNKILIKRNPTLTIWKMYIIFVMFL